MPRRRDPVLDPAARLPDYVWRLRNMGHIGNMRLELPLWTGQDVRWVSKILAEAAADLQRIAAEERHLEQVLRARARMKTAQYELRRRTSDALVRGPLHNL